MTCHATQIISARFQFKTSIANISDHTKVDIMAYILTLINNFSKHIYWKILLNHMAGLSLPLFVLVIAFDNEELRQSKVKRKSSHLKAYFCIRNHS